MLVYAGIDEAGYGPMLGPLCVACSVFVVNDHDPDAAGPCDLWRRLKNAVCKKRADKRRRIAIDDSKKIKLPNDGAIHPLRFLERGVLGFCMAIEPSDRSPRPEQSEPEAGGAECPACDADLFDRLAAAVEPAAWYESSTPLPVAHTMDELRVAVARLRKTLRDASIAVDALRCEAIDAAKFNAQVQSMGNKASVNFCSVLRHIDAVWTRWPHAHPRVIVDRQGGRMRYVEDLLRAWPDSKVQILAETETLSRYRLERDGSLITISFAVEAESSHLPVALASMAAKYVRELMMLRLNRYFNGFMPELKPTAGYTEDARRYLAELEPLMRQLNIDRSVLVRSV